MAVPDPQELKEELDALRAVRDTELALDFTIFDTWERRPSRAYDALRDRGDRLIPVLTDAVSVMLRSEPNFRYALDPNFSGPRLPL